MANVKGAEDWSVLNQDREELDLTRMQANAPSVILTLLTKGDVMVSVVD